MPVHKFSVYDLSTHLTQTHKCAPAHTLSNTHTHTHMHTHTHAHTLSRIQAQIKTQALTLTLTILCAGWV